MTEQLPPACPYCGNRELTWNEALKLHSPDPTESSYRPELYDLRQANQEFARENKRLNDLLSIPKKKKKADADNAVKDSR